MSDLGGLPEDVHHHFDREAWSDFLHGLYTPPVRLQTAGGKHTVLVVNPSGGGAPRAWSFTYLIIVAFGEEKGTELAVQCCLVGLVAMFG